MEQNYIVAKEIVKKQLQLEAYIYIFLYLKRKKKKKNNHFIITVRAN